MKKVYKELFDRISPQSSNEEFLSQILGKAEKMKNDTQKENRRFLLRKMVIIIAAVIALSGFTFYAAEIGIFSLIFNDKDYSVLSSLEGEMQDMELETYIEGLTVTPVGYAADSNNIISVFRLDFSENLPEGEFFEKTYPTGSRNHITGDNGSTFISDFMSDGIGGGDIIANYKRIDENSLYYIYRMNNVNKISGDIHIRLTCFNLAKGIDSDETKPDFLYQESLFKASYNVTIPEFTPTCIDTTDTEFDDWAIEISTCSYKFTTDNEEEFESMYPNYADISVTLKSGETIKAINPIGYSNIFSGLFEFPVIPEEIKSINIGGHIIELK